MAIDATILKVEREGSDAGSLAKTSKDMATAASRGLS